MCNTVSSQCVYIGIFDISTIVRSSSIGSSYYGLPFHLSIPFFFSSLAPLPKSLLLITPHLPLPPSKNSLHFQPPIPMYAYIHTCMYISLCGVTLGYTSKNENMACALTDAAITPHLLKIHSLNLISFSISNPRYSSLFLSVSLSSHITTFPIVSP